MEGWDGKSPLSAELLGRVASRYLEFNNRNAELARQLKPSPTPETPAETKPAETTEPARPAEAKVEPAQPEEPEPTRDQITVKVEETLDRDATCVRTANEYAAHEGRLKELGSETTGLIGTLAQDVAHLKRVLELPDIKENPLRSEEITRELWLKQSELQTLKSERAERRLESQRLSMEYDQRANSIRSQIQGQVAQRVATTRRAKELSAKWPGSLDRVIQANNVPADIRKRIGERVRDSFVLAVNRGETIDDLDSFIDQATKGLLADHDAYYRAKSADLGALAHKRTETIVPPANGGQPASPTATAPKADVDDLSAILEEAQGSLHRGLTLG
jgi:hypothetical protein